MHVFVRIRPLAGTETGPAVEVAEDGGNLVLRRSQHGMQKFCFDAVLDENATQSDVYELAAKGVVGECFEGI